MKDLSPRPSGQGRTFPRRTVLALGFFLAALPAAHASSLQVETMPRDGSVRVGAALTLTITLTGSRISGTIRLPAIDGLTYDGSSMHYDENLETFHYFLTPTRPGDFTIPGFDIRTQSGEKFHVADVRIHAG